MPDQLPKPIIVTQCFELVGATPSPVINGVRVFLAPFDCRVVRWSSLLRGGTAAQVELLNDSNVLGSMSAGNSAWETDTMLAPNGNVPSGTSLLLVIEPDIPVGERAWVSIQLEIEPGYVAG